MLIADLCIICFLIGFLLGMILMEQIQKEGKE